MLEHSWQNGADQHVAHNRERSHHQQLIVISEDDVSRSLVNMRSSQREAKVFWFFFPRKNCFLSS
jgi:hypothetical protein